MEKTRICQHVMAILMLLLFAPVLVAQDLPVNRMVRYGPEYEFRDEIYTSIEMVKANRPIPPSRIVTDLDRFDNKFYEQLLSDENIVLYDDLGVRALLKSKNVWGYAFNGVLYIQIGNRFHRLILEGSISRFMASATTYEKTYSSPGDPYYRGRPMYYNTTSERKVYLLDFESNVMSVYYPEVLGELLMRDAELYKEYNALARRQRKKRQLEFIQRYNERHPLYFPAQLHIILPIWRFLIFIR